MTTDVQRYEVTELERRVTAIEEARNEERMAAIETRRKRDERLFAVVGTIAVISAWTVVVWLVAVDWARGG